HADPAQEGLAAALLSNTLPLSSAQATVARVIREGRSVLLDEVDATAYEGDFLSLLKRPGVRSALFVPLFCEGKARGAIGLVCDSASGRIYSRRDLAFAEELAGRASLAIDNARLYQSAWVARDEA